MCWPPITTKYKTSRQKKRVALSGIEQEDKRKMKIECANSEAFMGEKMGDFGEWGKGGFTSKTTSICE